MENQKLQEIILWNLNKYEFEYAFATATGFETDHSIESLEFQIFVLNQILKDAGIAFETEIVTSSDGFDYNLHYLAKK